jgi:hypothetical protein
MKVKELIEKLQEMDQEKEIHVHSYMEQGRGGSWSDQCSFDLEEYSGDEEYEYSTEEDGELTKSNVVVLSVSGEETGYE